MRVGKHLPELAVGHSFVEEAADYMLVLGRWPKTVTCKNPKPERLPVARLGETVALGFEAKGRHRSLVAEDLSSSRDAEEAFGTVVDIVAAVLEVVLDMVGVAPPAVVADIAPEKKEPGIRWRLSALGQHNKGRLAYFVGRPGHRSLPEEEFVKAAYAAFRSWSMTWYSCALRWPSCATAVLMTKSWYATFPKAERQIY